MLADLWRVHTAVPEYDWKFHGQHLPVIRVNASKMLAQKCHADQVYVYESSNSSGEGGKFEASEVMSGNAAAAQRVSIVRRCGTGCGSSADHTQRGGVIQLWLGGCTAVDAVSPDPGA